MKKTAIRIISLLLIINVLSPMQASAVGLRRGYKNPLERNENEVRFSTQLVGDITEDIEILGVTVLPHTKSGNVAFEYSDSNSTNVEIGALLHIYIKNNSKESIYPSVTFGGKAACEYLDTYPQPISWASTPDTRANRKYDKERDGNEFNSFIPLTTYIPAGAVDCYSINVTDGKLLYDGLSFLITANGKSGSMTLYGDYQYVDIERIAWGASSGDKFRPDKFDYYMSNNSSAPTTLNYIKIYDGTDEYYLHFFNEYTGESKTFNEVIQPEQPLCGTYSFKNSIGFKEYLAEFNITNNGKTYSIIQKTRPIINELDISVGWAGGDLEEESYIKAISSMHFNTVIGACGSSYYLRSEEFRKQYPIKIFGYNENSAVSDEMKIENGVVTIYDIDDIHAALPFGEPQLNDGKGKQQPMRVYNKLLMYRNAPYATNITLSHEPAFYRFAGLSDYCHYDAYRINAPFSDAWYHYYEYAGAGKYGVYWGAPLETQGDYMRTLSALNKPNPIAAWTQGANTWNVFPRFTTEEKYMFSPNPFELRIQAYENIANGASSLYWFNINGEDLLFYDESSAEMRNVNRELAVVGNYIAKQVPYNYYRANNFDINVNIGDGYALMYAIDLNYSIRNCQYKYKGARSNQSFSFKIPDYLSGCDTLIKITKDGVSKCGNVSFGENTVVLTDTVDMTAMYLLGNSSIFQTLTDNYSCVTAKETFNIYDNEAQYDELQADFGYSDESPYVPEEHQKLQNTGTRIGYTLLGVLVRAVQAVVTALIAFGYAPIKLVKSMIAWVKK